MDTSQHEDQYPDYLNPFGSDDEADDITNSGNQKQSVATQQTTSITVDEYPEYLSPFDNDNNGNNNEANQSCTTTEDYDDSLNPFGDEEQEGAVREQVKIDSSISKNSQESEQCGQGNPFGAEEADKDEERDKISIKQSSLDYALSNSLSSPPASMPHTTSETTEPPPVPLPRTKSLLKKEQALKQRQQQLANGSSQTTSLLSTTPATSSSSLTTTISTVTNANILIQRKKNKRNAPPVPINFKRQVVGSLENFEKELNEIGDKLALIEQETQICQENLKATHQIDEVQFATSRSKLIELICEKNSILRGQKELMYRKRELKLDQIHSDIEYELRMIGNKQLSHRTAEDEIREKDLLKRLVEIVEEKSDIVENLNKDTSCDNQDIDEAFRRLNIANHEDSNKNSKAPEVIKVNNPSTTLKKNENCDKSSIALGNKLSKIATLLPKGATIKGTMKLKRKRLFKKCDSRPIER